MLIVKILELNKWYNELDQKYSQTTDAFASKKFFIKHLYELSQIKSENKHIWSVKYNSKVTKSQVKQYYAWIFLLNYIGLIF